MLRRSLAYIAPAKYLFILKFFLMVGSFVPAIVTTFILKILTDHVILKEAFDASEVRFPPYIEPFVTTVSGLDPTGVLLATLAVLLFLVIVFGAGVGEGEGNLAFLAQGQDTASQSENMISAGWSLVGGFWGLGDLLCNIRLVQRVNNSLRTELFDRLLHLPFKTLDNHRIGDSVYRTMYDSPAIQGVCFDLTLMPAIALLGAFTSLFVMDYSYGETIPELFWLGLATMPLALIFTAPFASLSRRISQESRGAGTATTNQIDQQVTNVSAIQSHGTSDRAKQDFASASVESFRRFRRVVLVNIGIDTLSIGGALAVMWLWMFFLVSEKIVQGALLPGDFVVMVGLFGVISGTSVTFGRLWIDLQQNVAGVRRALFYLDSESDNTQKGLYDFPALIDEVRFENVSYSYSEGQRTLHNISFRAESNQMVALVGPTGAGKTTLAYLIPKYLTPTSGEIYFNNVNAADIRNHSIRKHVSFVFQEHTMFSESIRENLQRARSNASENEIYAALEKSDALELVESLPDKLDTQLGSNGTNLSVGQKQRLSIARGLLCSSPILILDEPTAALDSAAERRLISNLLAHEQTRMLFVIAHRLSTIQSADLILFLDRGEIIESGSHVELMSRDSRYRQYVQQLSSDS